MTSLALAELLQKDSLRDPKLVAGCLQQHRPDICHADTLCARRTWRKTCGNDVVKNSSMYKAGLNEAVERAEQMARSATGREERAWASRVKERVIAFDALSICNQRNLKASGRLEQTAARSYTGSVVVDRMLADLVRVPESAELPGPPAGTAAAASASAPTVDGRATTQQLHTQGNGCSADRLSPAARALMDDMLATVAYSRPKVFELVCALAFMSGRSLAELMATSQFSAAERERERAPYPWVLFQASPSSKTEVILLLCGSHSFLNGLKRLRSMKQVASAASCKYINSRFCKSANTAAKTVLGVASSAFSDVRALYVGLTLALYGSAKTTSKQMSEWTRRCVPNSNLPSTAKFLAACNVAYTDALPQRPTPLPVQPATAESDVAAVESEENEIEDVKARAGSSCAAHAGTLLNKYLAALCDGSISILHAASSDRWVLGSVNLPGTGGKVNENPDHVQQRWESMDGNKQHKTCNRQQGTSQYIGCFSAVHIACVHDLEVIADKSTEVGTIVLTAETDVRLDRDYVAREVASDQVRSRRGHSVNSAWHRTSKMLSLRSDPTRSTECQTKWHSGTALGRRTEDAN
ncbi:hypothetical protein JKP88DRAFT_255914 [Tribonema minus]|uniref:Uncharacterized protein n=1 Tax=Tribonema minus TaxID=303371 RepID=A0A836CES6_9STRA|nr:hypothetical protein JKP88DRAFT_255914 [Tribonema minus]